MKKIYLLITLCIICFVSLANDFQKLNERSNNNFSKLNVNSFYKSLNISENKLAGNPFKLDSIIYTDGTKEVFNYDESGNTTKFYYYEKQQNQDIQLSELVEFEYYNGNNVLFKLSALNEENKLTVYEQSEKIYDSEGRMTTEIYWALDENELIPYTFNFLTYSADSSALSLYRWDNTTNSWNISGYEISYFDNNGSLKQIDVFRNNNSMGIMELRTRLLFTYDSQGRTIGNEFLSAPYSNGIWEREMAFYHEYDNNGRMKSMINYRKSRGLMEAWYKEIIYYNEAGLANIIDCFSGTDSINNSLEYKIEYQYVNNSLSGQLESRFDKKAGELKAYFKYEFKHDNSIDTTGLILPSLEGPEYYYERNSFIDQKYFTKSVLKSFISFEIDTIAGQLVKKNEARYFYSRLKSDNTSSDELTKSTVKCSPNPFTDNISISLSEKSDYKLNVYDLTGKLKYNEQLSGNNFKIFPNINERGIYILELSSGKGKTFRTKIVRK